MLGYGSFVQSTNRQVGDDSWPLKRERHCQVMCDTNINSQQGQRRMAY